MLTGHPPDLLAAAAGPSWGAAGASDSHLGSEEGSTPLSWQSCLPPSCTGCMSGGQSAVTHTLTSPSDQQSAVRSFVQVAMPFIVLQCKVCAYAAVRAFKVCQSAEVLETRVIQGGGEGGSEGDCHFEGEKSDHNQNFSGVTPAGSLLLPCFRLPSHLCAGKTGVTVLLWIVQLQCCRCNKMQWTAKA